MVGGGPYEKILKKFLSTNKAKACRRRTRPSLRTYPRNFMFKSQKNSRHIDMAKWSRNSYGGITFPTEL
jgi:hypothetical protein